MYVFNRITVNPQLPKRIEKLSEIANNLWWSWNTEFLRLFRKIDKDLWEKSVFTVTSITLNQTYL